MITDRAAYQRLCEEESLAELRAMSAEESIAIGERRLTSELMELPEPWRRWEDLARDLAPR